MLLKQSYDDFLRRLQSVYDKDEAGSIRKIVFEWAAGISRSDILLYPQKSIDVFAAQKIMDALERLLQHEPVQYVTGEAWFYNLKFQVSPDVLIPRPETEELVKEVLDHLANKEMATVLDIGTGSGCIPIAIKKNAASAIVTSVDISSKALSVAQKNAAGLDADISFIELDILNELLWPQLKTYDVIVSNPPYIPAEELKTMHRNVTDFEPHLALFVPDKSPLLFYERITAFAKQQLQAEGRLFFEIHESYGHEVVSLLEANGFAAQIKKDIPGKERMVTATRSR